METGTESNSPKKPTQSEPLGTESQPPITTQSPSEPTSPPKKTGNTLPKWLERVAGIRRNKRVKLRLDRTPTGQEEDRDFDDQELAMGLGEYDEGHAKTRIDRLARRLATGWTIFLMYIVVAQGNKDGMRLKIFGLDIPLLPAFELESSEFIAVFTTTTVAVFGFLVIVANYLFNKNSN